VQSALSFRVRRLITLPGAAVHEFIIFSIGGLAAAGIYEITPSGLTLTYPTTGIFNWAHGAIGMISLGGQGLH
jgi:hypothetical protein